MGEGREQLKNCSKRFAEASVKSCCSRSLSLPRGERVVERLKTHTIRKQTRDSIFSSRYKEALVATISWEFYRRIQVL